ncbi:MAG: sigma-54-dependent Fis family transcriptional regulator [bacterium]|nr:sigma-54-dependent Fis family transcriptional regulator [bacterium]
MMVKNWMESRYTIGTLVARSAAMRRLVDQATLQVQSENPVLIVGDIGTGKRLLARALHNSSDRVDRPFVTMPAERLVPDALETLLFGSSKGEIGAFERADTGTLLLTGVESLSPVAQERLNQVFESGVYRTAKQELRDCSARVLCTAHSGQLASLLAKGAFAESLYEKMSYSVLSMPSMAERNADIPYLVQDVLQTFAERERVPRPSVPYHYMELLTRVEWPENARQLRNHVESVMALSEGRFEPAILLAHFDQIESPQTLKGLVRDLLQRLVASPETAAASATN